MGKKQKQTTQQNQQQSYNANTASSTSVPDTPDIQAYRAWQPQTDPGLSYQYANARNRLNQSFDNPLGGYATPAMRDAIQRSGNRQLNQDESQAFRAGAYDVNQQKAGQLGTLAGLTRGTNSTGTSSGTGTSNMTGTSTSQESGLGTWLPQVLGGAAQVGLGAMTGGASTLGKNRSTGGSPSVSPTNPMGYPF